MMTMQFKRKNLAAVIFSTAIGLGGASALVWAHSDASLPLSDFEIDTDANLVVDHGGALDWGNVAEIRKADTPSGSNDDSFGQGSKEDTAVPSVTDGSIPPNKSDLFNFGVFQEGTTTSGFLHLFWHRVQDPKGTTNMDFEFNQSQIASSNGVTPVRTAGDLLIIYELAKGGTVPELFMSTWLDGTEGLACEASNTFPCWGVRMDLTSSGDATGSINTSSIAAADADGLGAMDPRTFGEASIDLSAIFTDPSICLTFGSAYLKSRSSDSFTAALKDFIAPVPINLSNCGTVKIIKEDDAGNALPGAEFELYTDNEPFGPTGSRGNEDTATGQKCTTAPVTGICTITNVLQGPYWVVEIGVPAGHTQAPDAHVIVAADAEVEVTIVDPRIPAKINIDKKDDTGTLLGNGWVFTLYNDVNGDLMFDDAVDTITNPLLQCSTTAGECTIDNILPAGKYCVVETTNPQPGLYGDADPQCVDLALADEVDLTFVNPRLRGAIKITKTRKHKASGGTSPHAGVTFTVNPGGHEVVTDENGEACVDGLLLSGFQGVGDYDVIETVPAGYEAEGATTKTVTVDNAAACDDVPYVGEEVSFVNIPLTDVVITVDSLVDGGTETNVQCTNSGGTTTNTNDTGEDLTVTLSNRLPGIYTCVINIDP